MGGKCQNGALKWRDGSFTTAHLRALRRQLRVPTWRRLLVCKGGIPPAAARGNGRLPLPNLPARRRSLPKNHHK